MCGVDVIEIPKKENTTTSDLSINTNIGKSLQKDIRTDHLYLKRKKQNKDINKNIREANMSRVRFSSPSKDILGHQWDLIHTIWINNHGEWHLEDISGKDNEWSFEVWSNKSDQFLTSDAMYQYTVDGVKVSDIAMNTSVGESEGLEYQAMIDAVIKGSSPETVVNRCVEHYLKKLEASDDLDGDEKGDETFEIDLHQKHLSKAINTLNSKGIPHDSISSVGKRSILRFKRGKKGSGMNKSNILSILRSSEVKAETVEWQFAIRVARDKFSDSMNVLTRNNIDPLTSWNEGDSAFIAFKRRVGGDRTDGFKEEDILAIIDRAGISAELVYPEDNGSSL